MIDICDGEIWEYDGVYITVRIPYGNIENFTKKRYDKVRVELLDGRCISRDQQKKIHAMINEIAEYSGDAPLTIKRHLKLDFVADSVKSIERKLFSLSDCGMDIASEFINHLINVILEWGIPLKEPLYTFSDDIPRYIYATLIHRKCAVCGKRGELHHDPPLGMGIDRTETPHLGRGAICLCREHHTLVHSQGRSILDEHRLIPVPIDEAIAKVYKLKSKRKEASR